VLRRAFAASLTLLLVQGSPVRAADIHVLCSNGLRAAVEELRPRFERASGHTLVIQFSSTASLKQRIEKGEAFDVALLTSDAIDDLITAGRLSGATHAELSRSGIGVGYRKGASKPDVRTPDAVRRTMLQAKSIAYTRDGASRPHVDRMFERLGITADVTPKIRLQAAGQPPESVAQGQSELVITLISEILPVAGIELAGPLPSEFQSYVAFAGAASARGNNLQAVQSLITFLDGPDAVAAYKAKGMEPR
jgi:molybdate transport system substrate-binding protein